MPTPSSSEPDPDLGALHRVSPKTIADLPDGATIEEFLSEHLRTAVKSEKQDVHARGEFAPRLFVLACLWIGFVGAIVLAQGFSEGTGHHFFRLNDNVLIALLGSTTLNVIGLFYAVAKYLFPERK